MIGAINSILCKFPLSSTSGIIRSCHVQVTPIACRVYIKDVRNLKPQLQISESKDHDGPLPSGGSPTYLARTNTTGSPCRRFCNFDRQINVQRSETVGKTQPENPVWGK
ncbi:PREDICTED: uncharacterized protein LOC108746732 [Trachymyrmex septentrionalis]|uniref:uncharacterized protein LOC108746732 n=1 Tax=Trachymyrmex septentrionalis TaxID=34720 RepID=UPI00084F60C9|nr:PREDICTED: uncharacterized protein LOC108746732 [Trachymyrmex septentrionalis]